MTRFSLGITLIFLCLATAANAATGDVPATLRAMLVDYRRYAETLWHAAAGHPDMGYWGTGRADWNNEGARAVSNTALAYATLYANGDHSIAVKDRIEPALRYETAIYKGGPLQGTDGKQWGEGWQSAMYAANMGVAAFLVKDQLDPQVLAGVKRLLASEADRFITMPIPSMLPGDTKAEENAWDLTAPAAALLLMPDHPHASEWDETVQRWGFNTLSVEADRARKDILAGKPVGEWVTTAQLFPDYTLDNHGFFHPVYAMVAPATLGQAAVDYRLAGLDVPEGLKFNVLKEWDTLKYIALPDGEWIYPQGLDWELHDYEHVHYWTMLATLYQRPEAALLEQRLVAASRRRQVINGDGRFVGESSRLGFAREAVQAERTAFALMMHQKFGEPFPASEGFWDQMVRSITPARVFDGAGFVLLRAERGVASFSWKNHLMGLVVPDSRAHLDQPYVTTPYTESLVGGFTVEGQPDNGKFALQRHRIVKRTGSFTAFADALINGGALRQNIAVAAVAPGVVAYLDRVTAERDAVITEERGLPTGIENDELTGDRRITTSKDETLSFHGGEKKDTALPGHWVNVEGRLGIVSVSEPALLHRSVGPYNRSGAREDILFGAYRAQRRPVKQGDVVARRAALLLPNATPEETARVAESARLEQSDGTMILSFTGPDGRPHWLSLDDRTGAMLDEGKGPGTPAPASH